VSGSGIPARVTLPRFSSARRALRTGSPRGVPTHRRCRSGGGTTWHAAGWRCPGYAVELVATNSHRAGDGLPAAATHAWAPARADGHSIPDAERRSASRNKDAATHLYGHGNEDSHADRNNRSIHNDHSDHSGGNCDLDRYGHVHAHRDGDSHAICYAICHEYPIHPIPGSNAHAGRDNDTGGHHNRSCHSSSPAIATPPGYGPAG
jgi:hypothetical protein